MSALLAASSLVFGYAGKQALRGIGLEAGEGEILALLGPNGSGKSTLLRLLAGLDKPWSGRVFMNGRDAAHLNSRARARFCAYLPQREEDALALRVRQSVLLGRSPWQNWLGLPDREDRALADWALEAMRLRGLENKRLNQISGGERQRAALARALCQTPRLFLLDEPTSALDYRHQIMVMDLLKEACRSRKTAVVIVSHDVNLAAMYAGRVALLKNGRILAAGSPGETLTSRICTELYDCPMQVDRDPATGAPRVTPITGRGM